MSIEDNSPVEDWQWLDDDEDWGYPVGFLCIGCFWDADRDGCKDCAGSGRTPLPFSEMWGCSDE